MTPLHSEHVVSCCCAVHWHLLLMRNVAIELEGLALCFKEYLWWRTNAVFHSKNQVRGLAGVFLYKNGCEQCTCILGQCLVVACLRWLHGGSRLCWCGS
eukprot:5880985-Amphidinium_carterae.1